MGLYTERNPRAVFLASVMRCEDCEYPCEARENSSQANCERHMEELLQEKKVSVSSQWYRYIKLERRPANERQNQEKTPAPGF